MTTIRIDEKHSRLLDRLISQLTLRGNKISKKELLARLIEQAMKAEGLDQNEIEPQIDRDEALKELDDVFELGISDLSERVDEFLYKLDGED